MAPTDFQHCLRGGRKDHSSQDKEMEGGHFSSAETTITESQPLTLKSEGAVTHSAVCTSSEIAGHGGTHCFGAAWRPPRKCPPVWAQRPLSHSGIARLSI